MVENPAGLIDQLLQTAHVLSRLELIGWQRHFQVISDSFDRAQRLTKIVYQLANCFVRGHPHGCGVSEVIRSFNENSVWRRHRDRNSLPYARRFSNQKRSVSTYRGKDYLYSQTKSASRDSEEFFIAVNWLTIRQYVCRVRWQRRSRSESADNRWARSEFAFRGLLQRWR